LTKVEGEVAAYQRWAGMGWSDKTTPVIVQLHQSSLMVDDADSEILLDADKKTMGNEELAQYIELVRLL